MTNQNNNAERSAKYHEQLHQGASSTVHQFAKQNRKNATEAEKKLWSLLRNRRLKGKKFRRQHPIAHYVPDFYCHECRLGIELDGSPHRESQIKKYDASRENLLNELGITVIRFWNSEVINDPVNVLLRISSHLY